MRKKLLIFIACLFIIQAGAVLPSFAKMKQEPSLYTRLGGYDALAAVTDDLIGRLAKDPQLSRFLVGLSNDSKMKLRQNFVDFMCAATGGPCYYVGRDMKTAHKGLHITEADWAATVSDLVATLDKFKVPAKEKKEVLTLVSSLKNDIVESK